MPTWPATLPQFVLEGGYQETLEDLTVESQMDTGPAKVRRRFTTSVRKFQISIMCDEAQAAIFETFYTTTCGGGALSFDWVHPRTRVARTFRFKKPPPTVTVSGGGANVRYSFALETVL
jgi:hypothetical protein